MKEANTPVWLLLAKTKSIYKLFSLSEIKLKYNKVVWDTCMVVHWNCKNVFWMILDWIYSQGDLDITMRPK